MMFRDHKKTKTSKANELGIRKFIELFSKFRSCNKKASLLMFAVESRNRFT